MSGEHSQHRVPREAHRAVYIISVAADLAGVHPQTLRIYERKGLVSPARTGGGSRRYSDSDIEQLRRISQLTEDGLNLAGVKRVLELEAEVHHLEEQIGQLRQEGEQAVADTHRHYRRDIVPVSQSLTVYQRRRRGGAR